MLASAVSVTPAAEPAAISSEPSGGGTPRAKLAAREGMASPEEVAATAVFLVSEEAGYISGVVMPIDGGFMGGGVIKRQANPGP